MATTCPKCGVKRGVLDTLNADLAPGAVWYCAECRQKMASAKARKAQDAEERLYALSRRVIVTTTPTIEGYSIVRYLGIESVEFVIGTGLFSEVTTSVQDFLGARSSAFERKLKQAKTHAIDALKFAAAEKGANAVVAVDMDFSQFSDNRIALIINGTLVKLDREPRWESPSSPAKDTSAEDDALRYLGEAKTSPEDSKPAKSLRAQEWMPDFPEDNR